MALKKMKKILIKIIAVIIAGLAIGAAGFYFWKDNYVTQADVSTVADGVKKEKNDKALILQAENDAEKEKDRKNEAQIISYIEKNISKITGLRISSAQKLMPIRIWFIDSAKFYVDYKDGKLNLRRILINQLLSGNQASYEVLGYFAPGDNGWVLESGRDIEGTVPARLYEKNEETGEWVIK